MRRLCKYCGEEYDGDPSGSCCPACAAAQRKTTLQLRTCRTCGTIFWGGPRAKYCHSCRAERTREANQRYRKNGPVRTLGSTDNCLLCGEPYTVTSGNQKYCPSCAPGAIRQIDRAQSLAWNRENTTPEERRTVRQAASAPIPCAICGKLFVPGGGAPVTCSTACRAALAKQRNATWEQTHREYRGAYRREQRLKKEATMTPEEYLAYRSRINAKARECYRKRKNKEDTDHD